MLSINGLARNAVTKPVSTFAEYAPVRSDVIYQNPGNCRSIVLKYVSLQEANIEEANIDAVPRLGATTIADRSQP
jgi:hypothetical protein